MGSSTQNLHHAVALTGNAKMENAVRQMLIGVEILHVTA